MNSCPFQHYESRDGMSDEFVRHIMSLYDRCTCVYSQILREAGSSQVCRLADMNRFMKDEKHERLITYNNSKSIPVAFLHYWIDDSKSSHSKNVTYIQNIFVSEDYRRQKIASRMVRELFQKREHSEFSISVYNDNKAAVKFWNSVGFVNKLHTSYILSWD